MGGLGQREGGCGKAETLCPYPKTPFKVLPRGGPWCSPAMGHKESIPAQLLPRPRKSSFSLKSPLTFSRALELPIGSCLATMHLSRWRLSGMTCSKELSDLVKIRQQTPSYYWRTDGHSGGAACAQQRWKTEPQPPPRDGTGRGRGLRGTVRHAGLALADGVCGTGAGNWAKTCPGGSWPLAGPAEPWAAAFPSRGSGVLAPALGMLLKSFREEQDGESGHHPAWQPFSSRPQGENKQFSRKAVI